MQIMTQHVFHPCRSCQAFSSETTRAESPSGTRSPSCCRPNRSALTTRPRDLARMSRPLVGVVVLRAALSPPPPPTMSKPNVPVSFLRCPSFHFCHYKPFLLISSPLSGLLSLVHGQRGGVGLWPEEGGSEEGPWRRWAEGSRCCMTPSSPPLCLFFYLSRRLNLPAHRLRHLPPSLSLLCPNPAALILTHCRKEQG